MNLIHPLPRSALNEIEAMVFQTHFPLSSVG